MKAKLVYSDDGRSLIKACHSREECANELRVYRLKLPFTPELIRIIDDRTIEISRIRGRSLSNEHNFDPFRIGRILADLHKSEKKDGLVLSHIDTNPRNYLIDEESGKYFLIDFSESGFSYPEHDLVNFLLFWGAIFSFNQFVKTMDGLLNGYNGDTGLKPGREQELFPDWIEIFDERRRRFDRSPCQDEAWQARNRQYMSENFYRVVQNK